MDFSAGGYSFTAQEVEEAMAINRHGGVVRMARKYNRSPASLSSLRGQLQREGDARMACGAFLPDNLLPSFINMRRIWREHKP